MKRFFIFCLVFFLTVSSCACSNQDLQQTDPVVEAYRAKAQEYIDSENWDTAVEVLEEGITKTGSKELQQLLAVIESQQTPPNTETLVNTEITEETSLLPENDTPPIDRYLGLWSSDTCQITLTRNGDITQLEMSCISYRVEEFHLELTIPTSTITDTKAIFHYNDDGFGNSGDIVLYLGENSIDYVVSNYVVADPYSYGLHTGYSGGSLVKVFEQATAEPFTYEGQWVSEYRTYATIEKISDDEYHIEIRSANSAEESDVRKMTAHTGENSSLFSNDCTCTRETYDSNGSVYTEILYKNGSEWFYLDDAGILFWNSDSFSDYVAFEKKAQ